MIMGKELGTTTMTTIATVAIMMASAILMTTITTTTVVYAQTLRENITATTTTNATTTTTAAAPTNLEFEDEPFAETQLRGVSENVISETQQVELVFEGNTTITMLPNTTETITTRDVGEGVLTLIPGGAVLHGQLQLTTEDGSESAIALFTEHFNEESSPTAISLVQFITNSTGILAPLNNMIAITLDQEQPDGSVIIRYFEWEESDDDDDEDEDDDGETEEE